MSQMESLLDDAVFARRVAEVISRAQQPASVSQPPPARKRRVVRRRKKLTLAQIVRAAVVDALKDNRGNISATAKQLDIARVSVQRMLKRYGLPAQGFRSALPVTIAT